METLEIHSKDFLVKWIHAPDNSVIDWQAKPLKKSINFAIYKKNEDLSKTVTKNAGTLTDNEVSGSTSIVPPTANGSSSAPLLPPPAIGSSRLGRSGSLSGPNSSSSSNGGNPRENRLRSGSMVSVNQFTESVSSMYKTLSRSNSVLSSNLISSDLTLVKDYKKLVSGELVHGKFEVKQGGIYAFIFDNSFSKTIGKKVLFSTKILSDSSPRSLPVAEQKTMVSKPIPNANGSRSSSNKDLEVLRPKNGELLQGVLSKRRRKKMQGFTKRFFVLSFKYGTLSYFKLNDNKLRGQMPIKHSIVSVNSKSREIIIDSGMEAWDLKTPSEKAFNTWVDAFNQIKKEYYKVGNTEEIGTVVTADSATIEDGSAPKFVINELANISDKLSVLKQDKNSTHLIDEISNDVDRLLGRLQLQKSGGDMISPFEDHSIYSSSDFYDAKEYLDAINSGVVFLNGNAQQNAVGNSTTPEKLGSDIDDEEEDDEEADDLSSASSISSASEVTSDMASAMVNGPDLNLDDNHDDNLFPLPHEPIQRDYEIPECDHQPPGILAFLRKNVGKDLSQVPMPVTMNEPISTLQKYSEMFEYCEIIENALQANCDVDTGERILRIAAFAVSSLSSMRAKERNIRKPFTPLLGETYELVREDFGIRIISEKVSHRPACYAMFVESKDWSLTFSPMPEQKFWGKNAEIITRGSAKLTIKSTGEVFLWTQPNTLLKNIIAGEKYGEPTGTLTIKSTLGYRAVVEFAKGGMFSGRLEDLTIKAYGPHKSQLPYTVSGKWTEALTLKTNTTERLIWTVGELIPNSIKKFGFTKFAGTLNKFTEIEEGFLPPTDSRFRPDLRTYEKGNTDEAEDLKSKLEEDQRQRRKENEATKTEHEPKFFVPDLETGEWAYRRGEKSYWNRRKTQDWNDLLKLW